MIKEKVMSDVKTHFRPEFLNRLDDIIIFTPLGVQGKYFCLLRISFYKELCLTIFLIYTKFRYSQDRSCSIGKIE